MTSDRCAPFDLSPAFVDAVRTALNSAGFSHYEVLRRVNAGDSLAVNERTMPTLLHATRSGDPLDVLIRLFILGCAVPESQLGGSLEPAGAEAWIRGGLLERSDEGLRSPIRLALHDRMVLAIDAPAIGQGGAIRSDHVIGLSGPTEELLAAALPGSNGEVLDLGTGCGGTAVAFAGAARRVVATDINPRAANMASFNARLNGRDNVEVRQGSLLEPAGNERFDLIAMNPPFVVSPGNTGLTYRDGGMAADGFVREVVASAPAHLVVGGHLVLLAQWAHLRGQPWQERLASWLEGACCETLAVVKQTQSPQRYAEAWLTESDGRHPTRYKARLQEWLAFYEAEGIEAISSGWLILRKRAQGDGSLFVREDVDAVDPHSAIQFRDSLSAHIFLRDTPDEALGDIRFVLAPGTRLEQFLVPGEQGWATQSMVLRVSAGLHTSAGIDQNLAGLLGQCDGRRPLSELTEVLAGALGADPARLIKALAAPIRQLVQKGALLPSLA